MSDTIVVLLTAFGGVVCGASVIGLGVMGFLWLRSNNNTAPALPVPPPPAPRPSAAVDVFSTYAPSSERGYRTFEHDIDPADGYAWLDGIGGMVSGQRIKIERPETVIGRSRVCDVQFHDPKVSRQHALLRLYNGRYFIQDMQSSRGTLVNKKRVETQMLHDGDEIRIGDSVVIFRVPK